MKLEKYIVLAALSAMLQANARGDRQSGEWIVFTVRIGQSDYLFYKMLPDGSHLIQLTDSAVYVFDDISADPSGTKVAYMTPHPGNDVYHKDIYSIALNGLNVFELINSGHGFGGVHWSKDGNYLYYYFQPDNLCDQDAYRYNLLTGESEFLYDGPEIYAGINEVYILDLRPQQDLYAVDAQAGCWAPSTEIFIFTPDLSVVQRLTNDNNHDWDPYWSPDGGKLAWTVINSTTEPGPNYRAIKVANYDGTDVREILHIDGDFGIRCGGWSPDGEWIIFTSDFTGNWEIYKLDPDSFNHYINLSNTPDVDETHAIWVKSYPYYTRGDANADATINVTDAVFALDNLFPPQFMCQRAADANADDALNVSDVLFLLGNMFPPTFPAPAFCGDVDTFNTVLTCDSFPPCGYYSTKSVEAINANAKIEIGAPEYGDGYVVMPVYMESDVEVAGIQLELSYDGDYSVAVETEGCVTEDFDYFRSQLDLGKVAFIGVYSLTPAMNGEGVAGLEAGRYRIAEIRVVGGEVPEFKVENAVLASRYGYSIEPEVMLGVGEGASRLPKTFALFQNVPNPFSGNTVIKYALPKDVDVELVIYNIAGQKVRRLVNGHERAGYRFVKWDGRDDAGRRVGLGVYFYKLKAGKFEDIKRMVLLK